MNKNSFLLVDNLQLNNLAGITTDLDCIDSNLAEIRVTKTHLISNCKPDVYNTFVYPAGGYVAVIQLYDQFIDFRMYFIHFSVSIEDNYDFYANYFSPTSIKSIFQTQQKIKAKSVNFQERLTLLSLYL